jgi:hypothetical protein
MVHVVQAGDAVRWLALLLLASCGAPPASQLDDGLKGVVLYVDHLGDRSKGLDGGVDAGLP